MINEKFLKALKFTLKAEGGFVNDPDDKGGATNFGITQATYDDYRNTRGLPFVPVKWITADQAKRIYFDLYWVPLKPALMIDQMAIAAFDFGVNSGVNRAIRKLQKVLGLKDDGIIGPITTARLQEGDLEDVVAYLKDRLDFVRHIGTRKFLRGWENRIFNLANYLGLEAELRKADA